jgi:hypothetical protein
VDQVDMQPDQLGESTFASALNVFPQQLTFFHVAFHRIAATAPRKRTRKLKKSARSSGTQ